MRRSHRAVALLSLAALTVGGCAAISGLSQITEQACAPNCDGGVAPSGDGGTPPTTDGTAPTDDATIGTDGSPSSEDSPTSEDAPATMNGPDASGAGDGTVPDATATAEASTPDSGSTDGGLDAPSPPVDSGGCGPVNTAENCSACGDKCLATNATAPACNAAGTTCSYSCNANYLDCNRGVAPDLDGCECDAPGATASQCCSSNCPQQHHYELKVVNNTVFYDCVPQGTFSEQSAMDACLAYAGTSGGCQNGYVCTNEPDGGMAESDSVCSSSCWCWSYSGPLTGFLNPGDNLGGQCYCPTGGAGSPTWN